MADINSVKSFKIPKRVKVENNETPCSSKEPNVSSADRSKISRSNDLKHAGKGEVNSFNPCMKINNGTGTRGTVIDHSGTGSEPMRNRGFTDRLSTGRINRIPSRLTPNIHTALPSLRKDNIGSRACTKQDESKSGGKNITDGKSDAGKRSEHHQIAIHRSLSSSSVSKDEVLDKNDSANSGRDVVSNKGLVNVLRVNGSRDKKSHMKNVDYSNENSKVVKEKRNFVMKKIVELDSDDGGSASDLASENSLLDIQNVSREKEFPNPGGAENKNPTSFEQKGVLDTIPKHHAGLDKNYFKSGANERPIGYYLPKFMQNALRSEPNVAGNNAEETLPGFLTLNGGTVDGRFQSFENGELKTLKRKEVGFDVRHFNRCLTLSSF